MSVIPQSSVTYIADGAVTEGLVVKTTTFSTTAGHVGQKAAVSGAAAADMVGFALRTVATTEPFEAQTSGIFSRAIAGGALAVSTDRFLTADADGKLVAAAAGEQYIARLLKLTYKQSVTAAAGDFLTVEVCHGYVDKDT